MKKLFISSLHQFASDFNLFSPDGVICFTANVKYQNSSTSFSLNAEVCVISIEYLKRDVLYLIDAKKSDDLQIPDMFSISEENAEYKKDGTFAISGNSALYGEFKLEIKPSKVLHEV